LSHLSVEDSKSIYSFIVTQITLSLLCHQMMMMNEKKIKERSKHDDEEADAQNVSLLLLNNIVLKRYGHCYSCSSNGTKHTKILIAMGHSKSLSWINNAPEPIVLSTDTPVQIKPSFISEKCYVLGQEHYCVLHAKTS
jgi:hypothetical protein